MANRLVSLTVKESSGVDKAANKRVFVLAKADTAVEADPKKPKKKFEDWIKKWFGQTAPDGAAEDLAKMYGDATEGAKTFDESLADDEAKRLEWKIQDSLWPLNDALCDSVASILLDPAVPDKRGTIAVTLVQYLDALQAKIPLTADQVIKVNALAEPLAKAGAKAGAKVSGDRLKTLNSIKSMIDKMIEEVTPMAAEADPVKKEGTMPNATDPAVTVPDTVTKADYEAKIAELTKAADEKNAALQKSVDEAKAAAEFEKNERLNREFLDKAANYPNLALSKADLGVLLKDVNDALNKSVTETITKNDKGEDIKKNASTVMANLEGVLKAADEAIKAGNLFKTAGSSAQGSSDALGKLEGLAKAAQAADPKLTKEAAMVKAMDQNPELVSQYQTEKGAA